MTDSYINQDSRYISLAPDFTYYYPFRINQERALNKISFLCTHPAVSALNDNMKCKVAIFDCNDDRSPKSPIYDCGAFSIESDGIKTITGLDKILQPGYYFVALLPGEIFSLRETQENHGLSSVDICLSWVDITSKYKNGFNKISNNTSFNGLGAPSIIIDNSYRQIFDIEVVNDSLKEFEQSLKNPSEIP